MLLGFHKCKEIRVANGQEKSGKFFKNDKSQEKWGFLKKSQEKSGNLIKLKKKSDFVSLNFQNSLFSKASKW